MNQIKRLWRLLGWTNYPQSSTPFQSMGSQLLQAQMIVRFYMLYLLYVVYAISMLEWNPQTFSAQLQPLWPLFWMQLLPTKIGLGGIILFAFASGMAAFMLPSFFLFRCLFCIGFFLICTHTNSYGRISHPYHALFLVSFILLLLPNGQIRSTTRKHVFLTVFWFAQLAICLTYSMSGFWKMYFGIQQLANREIGTFHPYALATLAAFRNLQTNQQSLLGDLVVRYPLVGWPLHYGAVYTELFSVIAVFRPALHRLWGCLLVLFHIGTWLLMGVPFPTNLMLVGLFLVMSPFASNAYTWRDVVRGLPVFGDLWVLQRRHVLQQRPKTTIPRT